jgi:peptidoglycan/xylan/chitin deacetylase (PgdA/CDA1 family)
MAATTAGAHHAIRWLNRRQLLIVVYHGVCEGSPAADEPGWHLIPVDRFRAQIEYLARHYDIVPVDQAIEALARGALRRPTACLTFDDGYANNGTLAFPVLQRYAAPATIYLATGLIGTERRLWTLRLEIALRRSEVRQLDLSVIGLGVVSPLGLHGRVGLAQTISRVLKRRAPAARDAALASIHAQLPDDGTDRSGAFRMMTWDAALALERTGLITFGGHTIHHELVARLDDGALESEICGSVAELNSRLARPSRTFAYPNGDVGDFDARAVPVLRKAGAVAALTTIPGLNATAAEPWTLRRVTVDGYTDLHRFRLITAGVVLKRPGWLQR